MEVQDVPMPAQHDESPDSLPSTSRSIPPRTTSHHCVTLWNPVNLKQEWTIANFEKAMDLAAPGMCLRSKPFSDESMQDIHWQLCLYPGGKREENSNHVSLFLKMSSVTPREYTVRAEYKFYFVDELGNLKFSNVNVGDFKVKPHKGSHSWGLRNIPKAKVLPCLHNDKSLRIVCQIELIPELNKLQTYCVIDKNFEKVAYYQSTIVKTELSKNLQSMLENDRHSDFIVKTKDGQQFKVHKAVLAARSPVFCAMLEHDNTEEVKSGVVHVVDVEGQVMKKMLTFMYSGQYTDNVDLAEDLLIAADKYQLEDLKQHCERTLAASITIENVCQLVLLGDIYTARSLREHCIKSIQRNPIQVTKTEGWMEIVNKHPALVTEIIRSFDKWLPNTGEKFPGFPLTTTGSAPL